MARTKTKLNPCAPEQSDIALLLIDVINDFAFPEAQQLLRFAVPMAKRLSALKQRALKAGVPVIYVNDNFGRWRSDLPAQVQHCLRPESLGVPVVERLLPGENDYFVLKPKHSGFFSTTLETLLQYLGAKTLIITGLAADICVLFTANDAYMREYRLFVPRDCVAANTAAANAYALKQIETILKADIRESRRIRFPRARR